MVVLFLVYGFVLASRALAALFHRTLNRACSCCEVIMEAWGLGSLSSVGTMFLRWWVSATRPG